MRRSRIYNRFMNFVLVLSLSILLSCISTKLITGKASVFGLRPLYIPTESMEPTIHAGSFALAVPADADDVGIGDIVVYKGMVEGKVKAQIVHRIIYSDGEHFYFKGDNNEKMDPVVSPDQIMYKVIWY